MLSLLFPVDYVFVKARKNYYFKLFILGEPLVFTLSSLSLFQCSYACSLDTSINNNNSIYSGHARCTLSLKHASKNVNENQDIKFLLEKN